MGSGGGTGSASGAQNKLMNNLSGYLTMNQHGSQSPNQNEIINPN